jgi:hypothetical protein
MVAPYSGSHVRDGGAICNRQGRGAGSEKFDELADHFRFPEQLGKSQREIGRCDSFAQFAFEMNAHDIGVRK